MILTTVIAAASTMTQAQSTARVTWWVQDNSRQTAEQLILNVEDKFQTNSQCAFTSIGHYGADKKAPEGEFADFECDGQRKRTFFCNYKDLSKNKKISFHVGNEFTLHCQSQ